MGCLLQSSPDPSRLCQKRRNVRYFVLSICFFGISRNIFEQQGLFAENEDFIGMKIGQLHVTSLVSRYALGGLQGPAANQALQNILRILNL